jgi:hypothetical protein
MTKSHYCLVLTLCLTGASASCAQRQPNPQKVTSAQTLLEKMPLALEVKLALSALPPPLRANASVYVLDPGKGYELEHSGDNTESCFVGRTEWRFADYRDDVFVPICYDAVGAKSHMRVWFDVAELRAKGLEPEAMRTEIESRFHNGTYKAPDRPGISYMTAPLMRTYTSSDSKDTDSVVTMSAPHVMYYAPNVTGKEVGSQACPPCGPYPFIGDPGPDGYLIQPLGHEESAKIVADEAKLLGELCSYRSVLCLPARDSSHSPSK